MFFHHNINQPLFYIALNDKNTKINIFDSLLLLISFLSYLRHPLSIINIANDLGYLYYLHHFNFNLTSIEKMFLITIFSNLQNINPSYFLSVKYFHLFYSTNHDPIILLIHNSIIFEDIIFYSITDIIRNNKQSILISIVNVIICLCTQICLQPILSQNLKRKLYHLFLFHYFYKITVFKQTVGLYLILILLHFSHKMVKHHFFYKFLDNKDKGEYVFSHIYLLSGCVYTKLLVDEDEYRLILVAVLLLDAFASLVGQIIKSGKKTFTGTLVGILSSYMIHGLMGMKNGNFDFYVFMGVVENLTNQNDNLILPFFGVIYLRLKRLFICLDLK